MPKFNTTQLVAFIKAHAITNYAKGWDVVVETMDDADIAERLGNASSQKAAIAAFADIVETFNEQRDMHRNEALLMGAEPTQDEVASGKVEQLLGAPIPAQVAMLATDLTDLEKAVVVAFADACIDCNGAETMDDMLSDNMTWADVAEIAKRTGLAQKSVKGVLGSLTKRGLVGNDDKPNGQPGTDSFLTDTGIRVAFELIAEGV
jgi:DNA-binding MarR family transcriptional regulator